MASPIRAIKPQPKWKLMVWTGCFAAIIFTGTIYGAGLKTRREHEQEVAKAKAERVKKVFSDTDAKVAVLEQRRAQLLQQKVMLEKKLSDLQERVEAKERNASNGR